MTTRKKPFFGFNLWLFDLVLTAMSFFIAYRIRSFIALSSHPLLPIELYRWLLAVVLPLWAVALPVLGVYGNPESPVMGQALRLSKALGVVWIVLLGVWFLPATYALNKLLVVMMLAINYALLVSYRLVALRGTGG